jgi:hypothetical protein
MLTRGFASSWSFSVDGWGFFKGGTQWLVGRSKFESVASRFLQLEGYWEGPSYEGVGVVSGMTDLKGIEGSFGSIEFDISIDPWAETGEEAPAPRSAPMTCMLAKANTLEKEMLISMV